MPDSIEAEIQRRTEALPEYFRMKLEYKFRDPELRMPHTKVEYIALFESAVILAEALKTPQAIFEWMEKPEEEKAELVSRFSADRQFYISGEIQTEAVEFLKKGYTTI